MEYFSQQTVILHRICTYYWSKWLLNICHTDYTNHVLFVWVVYSCMLESSGVRRWMRGGRSSPCLHANGVRQISMLFVRCRRKYHMISTITPIDLYPANATSHELFTSFTLFGVLLCLVDSRFLQYHSEVLGVHYKRSIFSKIFTIRRPISCPWGRDLGCLFILIYDLFGRHYKWSIFSKILTIDTP